MKQPSSKSIKMRIFNATQDSVFRDKCEICVKNGRTLKVVVPVYQGQILISKTELTDGWENKFKQNMQDFHLKYQQTIAH